MVVRVDLRYTLPVLIMAGVKEKNALLNNVVISSSYYIHRICECVYVQARGKSKRKGWIREQFLTC